MVKYYNPIFEQIAPGLLDAPLADSDTAIRTAALQQAASAGEYHLIVKHMKTLAADKSSVIRLNLAKALQNVDFTPDVAKVLNGFLKSDDTNIAANATVVLINHEQKVPIEILKKLFNAPVLETSIGTRIIHQLPRMGDGSADLVMSLMKHRKAEFRATALQVSRQMKSVSPSPEQLLLAFSDESAQVRRVAGSLVYSDSRITEDMLEDLVLSEYTDVRKTLVRVTQRFKSETAEYLLSELLLDEENSVRIDTLREYSRRKCSGYIDILIRSLEDPSKDIQKTVVFLLLRHKTPAVRSALAAFAAKTTDANLKQIVTRFLAPPKKEKAQ